MKSLSPISKNVVAVAGGISSGKSTLCRKLAARLKSDGINVDIFCYDVLRRGILIADYKASFQMLSAGLKAEFGSEVFESDGKIHRLRLNEIIFSDAEALSRFNELIDPLIIKEMRCAASTCKDLLLVEWPCILERKLTAICGHNVILLQCTEQSQLERLLQSDLSQNEVRQRIKIQGPCAERVALFADLPKSKGNIRYSFLSDREIPESLYGELSNLLVQTFNLRVSHEA